MQSAPPERGLRRIAAIIKPSGPIPVSRSTWWAGVKSGRFPAPIKLGPRITAWRDADIQRLVDRGLGSSNDSWMPAADVAIVERSS
jgi:predicted DNA-binding transcriptional regulator AlpA